MARGVNKVFLVGHVGKTPEISRSKEGKDVAYCSLATSESWKDVNGKKIEHTEWHNLVFFGSTAKICFDYVNKGSKLHIEGSLKTNKYKDKEGIERFKTNIVVSQLTLLDSKEGGYEKPPTDESTYSGDQYQSVKDGSNRNYNINDDWDSDSDQPPF